MSKRMRQYLFCLLAGISYLALHEGGHLIQALARGVFAELRWNWLGLEVLLIHPHGLSGWELACFSGLSSVATVCSGYLLLALSPAILACKARWVKSYCYYLTLVFLLLDPLYLCVFSLLAGGDINGIAQGLGLPYPVVRLAALAVFGLNLRFVIKKLYPRYTADFNLFRQG